MTLLDGVYADTATKFNRNSIAGGRQVVGSSSQTWAGDCGFHQVTSVPSKDHR